MYGISDRRADEAFTTGIVSGIGWLAIAETFPALMQRYLDLIRDADPIAKARAQRDVFPCDIRHVSGRYLQRFSFPDVVHAAVSGNANVDRQWYDVLARATRIAQSISPFNCLAIPTTIPVPDVCREAWQRWQRFVAVNG